MPSRYARHERPLDHAAEKRNELAPVHGPVPPVVPTEKIAHSNGRRLLHCGISTRLMTATGQKPNPSGTVACQLSPAPPDIPAHARSGALTPGRLIRTLM
jgi:hypothetical protein